MEELYNKTFSHEKKACNDAFDGVLAQFKSAFIQGNTCITLPQETKQCVVDLLKQQVGVSVSRKNVEWLVCFTEK